MTNSIIIEKRIQFILIGLFVFSQLYSQTKEYTPEIEGVWLQEGYGRIIKIEDSLFTYYNTTENSCFSLADGLLLNRFKIIGLENDKLTLNVGDIADYYFKRIDSLPNTCISENAPKSSSYEDNFKVLWNTFDKHYAFFESRQVDWDKVYRDYLPKVKNSSSDVELYRIFKEVLDSFQDGHIKLDVPDSLLLETSPKTNSADSRPKSRIRNDIIKRYLKNINSYNHGLVKWGIIKNSNVGYIQISDMNGFADYNISNDLDKNTYKESYDTKMSSVSPMEYLDDEIGGIRHLMPKILADLNNREAVIIDLRFNGGGYDKVALELLSYFVQEAKLVLSKYARKQEGFTKKQDFVLKPAKKTYSGKVYVLTSPFTASAAEIFTMGTLPYRNIVRIGTRTNGIFSEILWKKLPNGWEFGLSNEIYLDFEGKQYENKGIPPDIELDYSRDWHKFYDSFYESLELTDSAIEKVLELTTE